MARCVTGTANDPKEEDYEENSEGSHNQPETNPIGGSHGWGKEIRVRARSEMAGNLAGYATGIANDPKKEEEEEYVAVNHKQPARNPVGENQGWGNENDPTSAASTLGTHGRVTGRFTKHAATLPEEVDKPKVGTKARALHRVLMG